MSTIKEYKYKKFKGVFKNIEKECSDILNIYHKCDGVLYRGTNKKYYPDQKIYPRTNRMPKNTEKEAHLEADIEFKKLFGWKPRSEGVFCVGSVSTAKEYGIYQYIIFPKNGFKYVWSPNYDDFYIQFFEDYYMDDKTIDLYVKKFNINKEEFLENRRKEINDRLKEMILKYKDTDIEKAIKSYNEIMLKCDYYYLIDQEYINDILGE